MTILELLMEESRHFMMKNMLLNYYTPQCLLKKMERGSIKTGKEHGQKITASSSIYASKKLIKQGHY